MAVRLLAARPPYQAGHIVSYDAATEAGLVAANEASADLRGGTHPQLQQVLSDPCAAPKEFKPVDWYPDRHLHAAAGWLYGSSSADARDFVRVNASTGARTVLTNPWSASSNEAIRVIWVSRLSPGLVLACVGESSTSAASMRLWRSLDYGATWSQVLTLGTGGGGSIDGVWLLGDRSIAEIGGEIYAAEYNVNGSRTPGGTNDLVTLWRSGDGGATWGPALRWNYGGQHQMRHLHSVKVAPDGGLLILAGDTDAESALILWDRRADISNLAYAALPVPAVYGRQRCRAVDGDFAGGYFWFMGDGATSADNSVDAGWFRVPATLAGPVERLDGKISAYANRAVYWSCVLSDGSMVYIEEVAATPTTGHFNAGLWATNEHRGRIDRSGVLQMRTSTTGQVAPVMFQDGDTIYVSYRTQGLGKTGVAGTASFSLDATRRWSGVRPDTVHPVYWVDPVNGVDNTDTERGWTPRLPWRTLNYALTAQRVPYGGRVLLPVGDFEESLSTGTTFAPLTTNADATVPVVVDGAGVDVTRMTLAAASAATSSFRLPTSTVSNVQFKDLWLDTLRPVNQQAFLHRNTTTVVHTLEFVRARWGSERLFDGSGGKLSAVMFAGNFGSGGGMVFRGYDAEFVGHVRNNSNLFQGQSGGGTALSFYRSALSGLATLVSLVHANDTLYAEETLFANWSSSTNGAIIIGASSAAVPNTRNCRFHSHFGLPQASNASALPLVGQFVGARCTNALTPAALFDPTSLVDPSAAPADPTRFVWSAARK